ncbi:MAG TPA: SRPBCC family protein [Chitinophagales bacterium]|nr:SRPBCC family protein [Chitinophagales bacterium]
MSKLKKVFIPLVIIIAIPLIVALFVKKDYAIEESVIIDLPKSEVFGYIKYLKNQDHFSKWASIDQNMEKTFHGTDGTVGFISAWKSEHKDVGSGEQEIIHITEDERIGYELWFLKPVKATNKAYMTTTTIDENQTEVKWGFNGKMTYPMNLMLIFMNFEKMISDDSQQDSIN